MIIIGNPRGELNEDGTFKGWILDDDNVPILEIYERDALSQTKNLSLQKLICLLKS